MNRTIDAIASDWLALLGLGLLVGALVWTAREVKRLRVTIEPIATSPLVRTVAGIGG